MFIFFSLVFFNGSRRREMQVVAEIEIGILKTFKCKWLQKIR